MALPPLKSVDGDTNGHTNGHRIKAASLSSKSAFDAVDEPAETSPADNLKTLVQECGVSPHKVSELLQELPPLRTSDVLIDYYFSSVYALAFARDWFSFDRDSGTGRATPSPRGISGQPMRRFALTGGAGSQPPIPTTFDSYPSFS